MLPSVVLIKSSAHSNVAAEGGAGGSRAPPNNDIGGGRGGGLMQPLLTKRQYNCYSSPARSLAYIRTVMNLYNDIQKSLDPLKSRKV